MSFIELIGGIGADKAAEFDTRIQKLENSIKDLFDILSIHQKSTDNRFNNLEDTVGMVTDELNKSHVAEKDTPKNLVKRVDDVERMQRYLQNSQGRCLNDLNDIKAELYNMYKKPATPPEPKEIQKSVAKTDSEIKIIDILNDKFEDITKYEKSSFVRMLNANDIVTLEDLKKIPYTKLDMLPYVGEKNLVILQCIYEAYSEVDPKTIKEIKDNDLKKAIFENSNGYSMEWKIRILNALRRNGIEDLQSLSKVSAATVANYPNIGPKSMKVINNIYQNCIQA